MKMIHMPCPGHSEATLEGYILDCELTLGQEAQRPAIIVCPGGGYLYCSPREGEPVALSYAARGFHAFVLRYSTSRNAAGFAPMEEIDWAVGFLREKADEWHIHPDKIVTCGFSAGGHLALSAGLQAKNRPNAMILGYPAVNISQPDFMVQLLSGKETVTEEDKARVDLLGHIGPDAPPVFLAATAQDLLTGYGALPVAQKYSALGKPYELHIFQYGPHGLSLANETSADGSSQVMDPAFAQWQELSVQWLHRTFGPPTFVDKSTSRIGKYLQELGIDLSAMENA